MAFHPHFEFLIGRWAEKRKYGLPSSWEEELRKVQEYAEKYPPPNPWHFLERDRRRVYVKKILPGEFLLETGATNRNNIRVYADVTLSAPIGSAEIGFRLPLVERVMLWFYLAAMLFFASDYIIFKCLTHLPLFDAPLLALLFPCGVVFVWVLLFRARRRIHRFLNKTLGWEQQENPLTPN